jgi:hypothetical protein
VSKNAVDNVPAPERRHGRRQRALKGAVLITHSLSGALDCQIRDLSKEGARLRIPSTIGVPEEAHLLIPSEQRIAPVRVLWRTAVEFGVAFTGPWRPHAGRG